MASHAPPSSSSSSATCLPTGPAADRQCPLRSRNRRPTPSREAQFQRALQLVQAVKASLNDPSSLDVSRAYATDSAVGIEYRAKNAFGALVVNYAVLTTDGKVTNGPQKSVAGVWNKHIAGRSSDDLTDSIEGAKLLGAY